MAVIQPFTAEQERALINMRQRYDAWIDAERELAAMPYDLKRKKIGDYEYLYEIVDRNGNGKSLGRWDEAKQDQFDTYRAAKAAAKARRDGVRDALGESSRIARALRLPMISADAGPILREADRRSLLGSHLLVIGTSAMVAEAEDTARLWDMLKAVDPTFTVNSEREFQARNAKAYEVELLIAPSRLGTLAPKDKPRPVPLPEQEWLLPGRHVDQVIPCRDGTPARIVAPDPRWFALHKLWLGAQDKRNPLKRRKDVVQGMALLDAVAEAMPHYPLDDEFIATLPEDLLPYWASWKQRD